MEEQTQQIPVDRPEFLELTFPHQDSLAFWKDSNGESLVSPSLWIYAGGCYRAPLKDFRLYFLPAPSDNNGDNHDSPIVGRWCIYTGILTEFDGGFFCRDTDIPNAPSPANSIPYNTWLMRFGNEIEELGTVSCQAIPRQHIYKAIEDYVTTKASRVFHDRSARGVNWSSLIWEDLRHQQGRLLFPWLKENCNHFFQWGHEAYSLGRYHQAECVTSIIYLVLGNDNLKDSLLKGRQDQHPFSSSSSHAKSFVKEILKLPPGKIHFNDIGCGALHNLVVKCDDSWKLLIVRADAIQGGTLQVLHNLVRTHLENTQGQTKKMSASNLTLVLYDSLIERAFENRNFYDEPEALQTLRKICYVVSEAINEKKDKTALTSKLSETLGTMTTTERIYKEQESAMIDPTWWKRLPADVKEQLNLDAPQRFLCPITHEIMRNPSLLSSSGHTYERYAISWWMKKEHAVDPRSNIKIPGGAQLYVNKDLSLEICSWCEEEAKRLMGK